MGVSLLAEVDDDTGDLLLFERDIGVRILTVLLVVVLGVVVGVDDVVMFGV